MLNVECISKQIKPHFVAECQFYFELEHLNYF
jgi:hypothetical protein